MATSTRVKTTNKPTLKSQGAGYSTTNRKGETTYYKSAKDAPGYSDSNPKGNGSISKVDKTGQAIPMTALQPTPVANIPTKPTVPDYGAVAPPTPVTSSTVEQGFQNNQDWLNSALQSAYQEVGTGESRMAKLEKDNQLRQKEQAVNNATESLNQIVTKQQQDLISTRGTASANGVTEAVYGGIQNEINRNAALQALPVQAQLAAAQNNLELAQTHIDRMYAIQSQDVQAKYQYKTKVIESLYNFANAQQQRQLDQLNIQESRKYDEKKTNIAYQRDLAGQATQSGQSSLAGSIMRLDPNSPTYQNDLANLGGQVVDTTAQLQRDALRAQIASSNRANQPSYDTKAPDLQNFGTTENPDWKQYNPITGKYDEIEGVGGATGSTMSKVQKAKVSEAVVANKELSSVISEYKSLLDDVGFEGTTWGGTNLGKYKALKGRMTTVLKKAETLGTLDKGVTDLVDQLVGQIPEKGGFTQNFLGFKSRQISSQLQTQLRLIEDRIKTDEARLGGGGGFTLTTSDLTELDELFGETANSTSSGFDPSEYF